MIEFGEKIRNLRENKGMTQQTLADKLHVTRQAISRWECGARYPDIFLTKQIAQSNFIPNLLMIRKFFSFLYQIQHI